MCLVSIKQIGQVTTQFDVQTSDVQPRHPDFFLRGEKFLHIKQPHRSCVYISFLVHSHTSEIKEKSFSVGGGI